MDALHVVDRINSWLVNWCFTFSFIVVFHDGQCLLVVKAEVLGENHRHSIFKQRNIVNEDWKQNNLYVCDSNSQSKCLEANILTK